MPNEGSNRKRKRVGRGTGSGHGKTSGRGTKGPEVAIRTWRSRGFEGGQLPIQKRMPYKRGFTNIYKATWEVVNLASSTESRRCRRRDAGNPCTRAGVIRGLEFPVKILGTGEIASVVNVSRPRSLQRPPKSGSKPPVDQ